MPETLADIVVILLKIIGYCVVGAVALVVGIFYVIGAIFAALGRAATR